MVLKEEGNITKLRHLNRVDRNVWKQMLNKQIGKNVVVM